MESVSQTDEGYVEFLQDQVRRLNAILSEYQKKYLPVKEAKIKDTDPLPPWITNQSIITPMVVEYDDIIKKLQEQLKYQKDNLVHLKQRTDRVVQENAGLHEQLRRSIENQMEVLKRGEGSEIEKQMIDKMQYQLELISKEKDSYVEMWENATRELEKLQDVDRERASEIRMKSKQVASLQSDLKKARHLAESLQLEIKKMKMEYDRFLSTAQTQDQEIDSTRTELRNCKAELKASKHQAEEFKRNAELLKQQLYPKSNDDKTAEKGPASSESQIEDLQTFAFELETRLSAMIKEVGRLNAEKNNLEEQLETLQTRNNEMEKREFEAISHVRDSVQMVENSILERDQALLREQQKNQEAIRLQEVINKLLREAGKRTKDEVNSVRNLCNQNLQKLMEEIQYLEVEGAEKQAQLERAMREKTAVEQELEKVYQEGPSEIERYGLTFEELQKRISAAERDRDKASMSNDSLNSTIKRLQNKHDQEKTQLNTENLELRKRLKELETECEEISENRLQLLDEVDKLKREVLQARQGREGAEHERDTEISALKKKFELKEKEFDLKLRGVEEMNRKSVNDLREMLNTQQKIGIQWKEETKSLTERFENTVSELRQQLSSQKKRNDELNISLMDEKQLSDQLKKKLSSSKENSNKLQKMVADAESRSEAASAQVSTLLSREHQLLQERKLLNRELEKQKLVRSRPGNGLRSNDLLTNSITSAPSREPQVRLDLMSPRNEGLFGDLDGFERRPIEDGHLRHRFML